MPNATKRIFDYINKNVDPTNIKNWLYDNELLNTVGIYYDSCVKSAEQFSLLNTLATQKNSKQLFKVCEIFDTNDIDYITFKGVVLSCRLYNNPYLRLCGDIDIFVNNKNFNSALELLLTNGYTVDSVSNLKNEHHIVLNNGITTLELHKNILNPFTKINETYMRDHTENVVISNQKIQTFDITATLLHLFYHLYMDTCLPSNNIYAISAKTRIGIANRFLYRAYEIALFSKKYFKEIKWIDIISDIKTQKLRIIFKYMVDDILEIFPNAFPQELKKAIYNKSYIENEEDMFFYKFLEGYKNHKQEKRYLLCEFIEKFWQRGNNNALLNLAGSAIVLEDKDFNEFKCICNISRNDKKIHLEFTIEDDDIFFSDLGNYDTQKSDGIHLILCSTTEYSYNSIFFFPKNTKENNKVIQYDFLESRVIENDIIASYEMIENGYKLNVTLTEEFITKNHLESFFYLGLVVSSCSSKTKHREKQLVLSSPTDQWYNPLHFAKINI